MHVADGYNEWWWVKLGQSYVIRDIKLYNRLDCCQNRMSGAVVSILLNGSVIKTYKMDDAEFPNVWTIRIMPGIVGDQVMVDNVPGASFAELEVYADAN